MDTRILAQDSRFVQDVLMTSQEPRTSAEKVCAEIRRDIYAARLQAGQRLKFPDLCARYGTSVGVAREALTMLAAERLVQPQAHVGYRVTPLSIDELADLTVARVDIESLTFRHALEEGGLEWESSVVAAHHLLSRLPVPDAGSTDAEHEAWGTAHQAFHSALLSGCATRRLRETAQALRTEAELYRSWTSRLKPGAHRDAAGEHRQLMEAVIARDVERGPQVLRDHIAATTQTLIASATEWERAAAWVWCRTPRSAVRRG
jgi:DNA-binding GntR family transcriptional regulator